MLTFVTRIYKNNIKKAIFLFKMCLYICREKRKQIKGDKKMARVLISMPEKFLDEIDQIADTENRSRSELIREALRTYIHRSKIRENTLANKNASILEALLD